MRHRSPRPFLDLWQRPSALPPLHRAVLAVAALVSFGTATGLSLAAQSDQARGGDRAVAQPDRLPTQTSPSQTLSSGPARQPAPSRSADRRSRPSAGSTPSPSDAAQSPTTSSDPSTTVGSLNPLPSAQGSTPAPPQPTVTPVDSTAPSTTARTVSTDDRSWVVVLGASEPATFECSLDGAGYTSCPASTTFANLDPGHHTLAVRASDEAGNTDPSPAQLTAQVTAASK